MSDLAIGKEAREDAGATSDPRLKIAFPLLSDEQIRALEPYATPVEVAAGETVWSAGATDLCMFLVREGVMSIHDGRSHIEIAQHVKGGFSGDIDVLSGRPVLVGATAATDLKLLK